MIIGENSIMMPEVRDIVTWKGNWVNPCLKKLSGMTLRRAFGTSKQIISLLEVAECVESYVIRVTADDMIKLETMGDKSRIIMRDMGPEMFCEHQLCDLTFFNMWINVVSDTHPEVIKHFVNIRLSGLYDSIITILQKGKITGLEVLLSNTHRIPEIITKSVSLKSLFVHDVNDDIMNALGCTNIESIIIEAFDPNNSELCINLILANPGILYFKTNYNIVYDPDIEITLLSFSHSDEKKYQEIRERCRVNYEKYRLVRTKPIQPS